eukprot:COSAG02_NODE_25272_length_663_cov_1.462766_1_plen_75_part_01
MLLLVCATAAGPTTPIGTGGLRSDYMYSQHALPRGPSGVELQPIVLGKSANDECNGTNHMYPSDSTTAVQECISE